MASSLCCRGGPGFLASGETGRLCWPGRHLLHSPRAVTVILHVARLNADRSAPSLQGGACRLARVGSRGSVRCWARECSRVARWASPRQLVLLFPAACGAWLPPEVCLPSCAHIALSTFGFICLDNSTELLRLWLLLMVGAQGLPGAG